MRKHVLVRLFLSAFFSMLFAGAAFAQPANDECDAPIVLQDVTDWCSAPAQFTNVGATVSTYGPATCFTGQHRDVWFSFTAVALDVTVTIIGATPLGAGGTLSRPEAALYLGVCGGTIAQQDCKTDTQGDHTVELYKGGLIIGETYFIRVQGRNNTEGTFRLCINNYNPPAMPGSDCFSAAILCNKDPFVVQAVTGAGLDPTEANGATCLSGFGGNVESNSTWFIWTAATAGTLTFTLTPLNPSDDLDFVVYELPNGPQNCNPKTQLRCMASGSFNFPSPCMGPTGLAAGSTDVSEPPGCNGPGVQDNFLAPLNMVAGRTYALMVNNFTSSGNGFSVSFGGTGTFVGPTAAFTNSEPDNTICVGAPITFTDASTFALGNIAEWKWSFGANSTPSSSEMRGPHTVTYDRPGVKSIALTVISDRGCAITTVRTITVECCADHFNTSGSATNLLCADQPTGAIDVSVTSAYPPYTYVWNSGQTTQDLNNLTAGNYTLTITDRATCTRELNFTLTQPPPLESDTLIVMPTCDGGTDGAATLNVSGGVGPYEFNWQGAGFTPNNTLANISRGDYPVVIRDANGCLLPLVIPVRELELILNPTVDAVTPPTCTGFSDGSIVVLIANGLPPFQYDWGAGFVNDNSLLNIAAGTYTVEVRDANRCLGLFEFNMEDHPPITVDLEQTNASCFGDANGTATAIPGGGVGNYSFAWSSGANTDTATGLRAGTYTVTVLDGNNCRIESAVTITEPPLLVLDIAESLGVACSYDTTGRIVLAAVGGTPEYEYSIGGGPFQFSPEFGSLTGGSFSFAVMDAQGCTATATGIVDSPPPIVVDAGIDQIIQLGFSANIRAVVNLPGLIISWTPPDSLSCTDCLTPVAGPSGTTTYTITAIDSNNCIAIDSITILVVKDRPIYFPNAFSPNDDGFNDGFTLYGGPAARQINRLRVFDRWGGLVFDGVNLPMGFEAAGWDGTVKGEPAQSGVYVFMAEVEFIDGESVLYEGDVTLLR